MLFMETVAVYCRNHRKYVLWKKQNIWMVKGTYTNPLPIIFHHTVYVLAFKSVHLQQNFGRYKNLLIKPPQSST